MTLNLGSPCLSLFSHPSPPLPKLSEALANNNNSPLFLPLLLSTNSLSFANFSKTLKTRASLSENENGVVENNSVSELLDEELLSKVSGAKDANEALEMIGEKSGRSGGVVGVSDCCLILSAALERNNADLALSVFHAMRASFDQGVSENGPFVERWRWTRPDVHVYTLLVQGLAASLRVSDALRMIEDICRVGVSPGEEVPFGRIVRCPSCTIAVAVAQPQYGIQIVSCAMCRYQYELISGDIVRIESEEIRIYLCLMLILGYSLLLRISSCRTQQGCSSMGKGAKIPANNEQRIPSAVHSIVVETPSGMARTHRFATETADLPAQEGERVTIAVAAPSNVYREVGPLKFSPKPPQFLPRRAYVPDKPQRWPGITIVKSPTKEGSASLLNPSILFPLLAVLASGDAASGIIDPRLPQFLSAAAVASLAVGATLNTLVLPQLNRLPQRSVDAIAIKQQLLSQYDVLQSRIKDLKEAAEKEVWMLARMCQLENKIVAVGEPSYRARRSRVKRVREGLENSLRGRIELIDSYARISSMIEIEVEMDSDVLAAEAASNVESIAEQIQQIMELENLEEKWKLQAEANDEAEKLLSSQPIPTEQV